MNGDLMRLLPFVTVGVLGADWVLGPDALLRRTDIGDTRAAKLPLG